MKNKNYYINIATKITKTDKEKFNKIADKFNMSVYELIQSLLLALVRYFDEGSYCSDEMDKMMKAFADVMSTTNDSFNPIALKYHGKKSVKKAILFVQTKEGLRPQMIEASTDNQSRVKEYYNIDAMLRDFLNSYDPMTLKALEKERESLSNFSLSQTLKEVVLKSLSSPQEKISDEVKTLFSDVRICTGESINQDIHYKRGHLIMDYSNIIPEKHIRRADLKN